MFVNNVKYIEKLLKSDLYDFQNLNNLFSMCRLLEKEDIDAAHKYNQTVKRQSALCCKVDKEGNPQNFENMKNFFRLNKLSYLFDAPSDFESFLIYMEWDREPSKRFYLPRRFVLKDLVNALQDMEDDKTRLVIYKPTSGNWKNNSWVFLPKLGYGKIP